MITDEAIERAAAAIRSTEHQVGYGATTYWEDVQESDKDVYRAMARAAFREGLGLT